MLSYWERKSFFPNDGFVIAGAGITGLSAALQLKSLKPDITLTVVDAGVPPGGATTRNAGFACIGSLSEILEDTQSQPLEEVLSLSLKRFQGLQALRQAMGDEVIGYEPTGNYEIFFPEDKYLYESCLNLMEPTNRWLEKQGLGAEVFTVAPTPKGLPSEAHYIFNRLEGVLDSGRLYQALIQRCVQAGVMVLHGLKLLNFKEETDCVHLTFESFEVSVSTLALCTNAFAAQLLPEEDVKPARGVVLVSEEFAQFHHLTPAGFHHFHGYNYFRFLQGRLLIGGGRHLNTEREFTLDSSIPDDIRIYLEDLAGRITGVKSLRFDYCWTGFMGKGETKEPIVKTIGKRVACAVRLGGMGVALGYRIGGELAAMLAKISNEQSRSTSKFSSA